MEYLREFWEWILAVLEHWHGWVSGGVVAFALEQSEKLWDWKPHKVWIYVILIAGLFMSVFDAWREQKEAVKAALSEVQRAKLETARVQASLDALNKPILSAEVSMISVAPSGQHKESSLATVICHFRNTGAPTALENFNLTVIKDSEAFNVDIVWQYANVNLYTPNMKVPKVMLLAQNHISKRLSQVLDRNTVADGWFQVVVHGLSQDKFVNAGTKLTITYRDVATNIEHSIFYTTRGGGLVPPDLNELSRETR